MTPPYLVYENWPDPPEDIVNAIYDCIETQPNVFIIEYVPQIKIYNATEKILQWTRSVFDFPHKVYVQVAYDDLEIHTDLERTFALNYQLELGGNNVHTGFYNAQDILLESYIIPEKKWARLSVKIPHAVTNIEQGKRRVTLSVFDIQPEPTPSELYRFVRNHYRRNKANKVSDVKKWMDDKGVARNKTK
jgi:hypothetical protein